MANTRIFVYGTLKRGYSNHRLLEGAHFLGDAYTVDTFKMIHVGYPVILPDDDGDPVNGEVFDVNTETLINLDALENEGVMYDRKLINVLLTNQPKTNGIIDANVSVYIGNEDFWSKRPSNTKYEHKNQHGELLWHP